MTVRKITAGEILIGNDIWSQPVALTSDGVLEDWQAAPVETLAIEHLASLIATAPELIVIGTGSQQVLAGRDLMFAMARSGIGLEIMDTPAAARTYNVLISEGRSVAAVLYPTDKS